MSVTADVEERGFAIVDHVVDDHMLAAFRAILDARPAAAGVRNLLEVVPETRDFVDAAKLSRVLAGIVSPHARIVRATLFDKSAGANWRVPWHQDVFVATANPADVAGFSAW